MNSRIVLAVLCLVAVAGVPDAHADCDDTPPALTNFSFTPSSINTTLAAQNVTCNMTVTDDLAGVASATCTFVAPTFQHTRSCTATTPTAGTYSCVIAFPRYAPAGTWTAQVTLADAVGNSQTVLPQFMALPFALSVTSDPDLASPGLTSLVLNPTSVNVSAAAQIVTCTMTVTDAKSGVDVALCQVQAPSSDQAQGCAAAAPTSGTRNNGVFACMFTMPRYSDAGTWAAGAFLSDRVGNFALPATGATLTVTASPEDIVAPSLTNFSLVPVSVNVASAPAMVTCTMNVADATAGVATALCRLSYTDPFNPLLMQSQECIATSPQTGTRNSGVFQCSVPIPRYSAGGLWDADVELTDLVGNVNPLTPPEQLDVDCGDSGGPLETTCRFSNKTTLTWDAIAGATRYNVYRGNMSGLADANQDHLPDGGYGTCQNSRDANLTDTTFVDADVPTLGQVGFHYLVSYTLGGVEQGLGETSDGVPRTVAVPCP